jgi:hypothetical protein
MNAIGTAETTAAISCETTPLLQVMMMMMVTLQVQRGYAARVYGSHCPLISAAAAATMAMMMISSLSFDFLFFCCVARRKLLRKNSPIRACASTSI